MAGGKGDLNLSDASWFGRGTGRDKKETGYNKGGTVEIASVLASVTRPVS